MVISTRGNETDKAVYIWQGGGVVPRCGRGRGGRKNQEMESQHIKTFFQVERQKGVWQILSI